MLAKANYYSEQVCNIALNLYAVIRFLKYLFCTIKDSPMNPHDRRSGADGIWEPWPGYLVGGGWPGPKDWVDIQDSYQTNEIAINWNAALIYAPCRICQL